MSAQQTLGLPGAVVIGVSAMVGAGVFVVFGPATASAGGAGMLLALLIAAVIAYANARSTARLAALHPVAGGVYAYGRREIGATAGFLAGWCFVLGKTASVAAMASTVAAYVAPEGWRAPIACAAVTLVVGIDLLGLRRSTRVAAVLLVGVLLTLGAVIAVIWASEAAQTATPARDVTSPWGVLQAAGLLFFAFAGYARVATLGEEVRDAQRTIPRAIGVALAIVLVVYVIVAVSLLAVPGETALAQAAAPLEAAVAATGAAALQPVVLLAAALACMGAMLALVAGLGRTASAMARDAELPGALVRTHRGTGAPWVADVTLLIVAGTATVLVDTTVLIAFSSCGVLLYYAVAHLAVLRRRGPGRWMAILGVIGCAVLVLALPRIALLAGLGMIVVGLLVRAARLYRTRGIRSRSEQ